MEQESIGGKSMKESQVQLLEVYPIRISVTLNPRYSETEGEIEFELEHMESVVRAGKTDNGEKFFLSLGVRSDSDSEKRIPYHFEIIVAAHVEIRGTPSGVSVEDLATRNGLTMLYGQVRELLIGNSARMQHGKLLLPSMSFMDCSFADVSGANEPKP